MPLAPEAQSLLAMMYRTGAPRFHDLSVEQARRSFQKLLFAFRPDAPAVSAVTEVPIPRPGYAAGTLLARLYRPLSRGPEEALPLLVYYHGGGWCVGDVAGYDVLCRQLANLGDCAVLSVDYRLAPEHPFPAAVDDAWLALAWSIDNADLMAVDPTRLALAGDSAGGNLTLVTALAARNRNWPALRLLLPIYPSTEIGGKRPSRDAYADGYALDRESLKWFFTRYLPGGDGEDWRASPLRAPSVAGLPPIFMVSAECDPLVDEGRAFAERVREEGGEAEVLLVPGVIHGFLTLGKMFPQAAGAVERMGAELRRAFAG